MTNEQLQADLRAVLALPQGRRYLFDVLERCGVLRDIWCPSAEIHRKAGMQFVGLDILNDIRAVRPELVTWVLQAGTKDEEETDA